MTELFTEVELRRAWAEYQEMPGLRLTVIQASRLWNVSAARAEGRLVALERKGFLVRTGNEMFVLAGPDNRLPNSRQTGD